jgi:2-polyprenyl-3-methyl-5-hydroxy-6-metoxy-1,4-benzoquinol methylase
VLEDGHGMRLSRLKRWPRVLRDHVLAVGQNTVDEDSRPLDAVSRRDVSAEQRPEGGGVEGFDTPEAEAINRARLEHLAKLELALGGTRVLEVGAGVGRLTGFFTDRGCEVIATDARAENVAEFSRRLPSVRVFVADVEESLEHLGRFDVVFCYGLLYHLENPLRALRNMGAVCDALLLVETIVCDSPLAVLRLEDETLSANQALAGMAHRPSPSWLALALNRSGFEHVYAAAEPPDHPDYMFDVQDDLATMRDGTLLRGVFVASRVALGGDRLLPLLG